MALSVSPSPNSSNTLTSDLRSPSFSRLRRGTFTWWCRVATLVASDAAALAIAWRVAEQFSIPTSSLWHLQHNLLSISLVLSIALCMLLAGEFYTAGDRRRDYLGIVKTLTLAEVMILLVVFFYEPSQLLSRSHFLLFWSQSVLYACAGRWLINLSVERVRTSGKMRYPVFLISDPEFELQSTRTIEAENRYNVVGTVPAIALDRAERERTFATLRRLGVVEAFVSWDAIRNRQFLYWHFQTAGITLHVLPIGLEPLLQGSKITMNGGMAAVTFRPPMVTGVDFWLKQGLDFCSAAVLLILLSPLLLMISALIYFDSPGPIFFKQTRIGLHGKPFKAWKFRTMVPNAAQLQKELEARNENKDGVLFKMKDDPRVTRVGKVLRAYSLDELPQLFNVLFGEMSLVGPRPLPLRDVEKFEQHHFIRHEVLPGITGLWQVSGRSNIDNFEDVINLDLSYIQRWSLWLDLGILLKTVGVVLKKTGAY